MKVKHKQKQEWVDLAKGLTIILVVLGHAFPPVIRNSTTWANYMWQFIYNFHMPVFFALSGYLYFYNKNTGWGYFFRGKFLLLVIPYLSWSLVTYIGINLCSLLPGLRMILIKSGYMINSSVREAVLQIITYQNHLDKHLWFIYVLFIIFLIVKLIDSFKDNRYLVIVLFLVSFGTHYLYNDIIPDILGRVLYYSPFFYMAKYIDIQLIKNLNRSLKILAFGIFVLFDFIKIYVDTFNIPILSAVLLYIVSVGGIISIIILTDIIHTEIVKTILTTLGRYSYHIYLIHQPFLVSGIVGMLFYFSKLPVYIITIFALILGLIVPIVLSKYVLQRSQYLRVIFLGGRSLLK